MRRVRYESYGFHGGSESKEGTVSDLLFDLPYLVGYGRPLPSLAALNALLRTGYLDAGMSGGCEWEPFELDEEDYANLVQILEQDKRLQRTPTKSLHTDLVGKDELSGGRGDRDDIPF